MEELTSGYKYSLKKKGRRTPKVGPRNCGTWLWVGDFGFRMTKSGISHKRKVSEGKGKKPVRRRGK